MARIRKLPEWIDLAKQQYASGSSIKQIAEGIGVAPATVNSWLKKCGVELRASGGKCSFDPQDAIRMWAEGLTIDQIGERLGVNRTAVYEQLKKHNVDTTPRRKADRVVMEDLINSGVSEERIALELGCSVTTVERHRRDVMGIHTTAFVNQHQTAQKLDRWFVDVDGTFDQFRADFPDVTYHVLVTAFKRNRPDRWVNLTRSPEEIVAIVQARKEDILDDLEQLSSVAHICNKYQIPAKYVHQFIDEVGFEYDSSIATKLSQEHKRLLLDREWCKNVVENNPTLGCSGIATNIFNNEVWPSTVKRYLERHGIDARVAPVIDRVPLLKDVEWLRTQYTIKTMQQIADELGVSHPTVRRALDVAGIDVDSSSHQISKLEKMVVAEISKWYSGPIVENDRTLIKPQEVDILLPELKVGIEVCGNYWHSELFKSDGYHSEKMKAVEAAGYRLVTIFEDELTTKPGIVFSKLKHILGLSDATVIPARKGNIREIDAKQARAFFEQHHIQGYLDASIKYGLFAEGLLIAAITFRQIGDGVYELSRFATGGVRVPGGFSKLLEHFKRNVDWEQIITFADRRWSTAHDSVYTTTGFTFVHHTPPSYTYYCRKKKIRYSRLKFQKHKMIDFLENFDPSLTERENANNHGYLAIYDCGNVKYVMNNPIKKGA